MTDETERLPLSVNQEAMWVAWQRDPEQRSNIIPLPFEVDGHLDLPRLRRAVEALASRYPQLCGRVVTTPDGPALDWSDAPAIPVRETEQAGSRDEALRRLWQQPFDLRNGPLLRIDVLRRGDSQTLLVAAHHLVNDGAAVLIMMDALRAAYGEGPAANGTAADLSAARHHAERSRELADGDTGQPHRAYWRAILGDGGPDFELRRNTGPGHYTMLGDDMPRDLEARLRACAEEHGVSYVTVLLAGYFALLRRCSGSDDLLAFVPFHGRATPELADQVGYFVNPLPVRHRIRASDRYRDLLTRVRLEVKDALRFGELPLTSIMRAAGLSGPQAHARTHQALFQYWHAGLRPGTDLQHLEFDGAVLRLLDVESNAGFQLAVMVREDNSGTHVLWKDPGGVFGPAQVQAMASDYLDVLAAIADRPGATVGAPIAPSAAPAAELRPERRPEAEPGAAVERTGMIEVWQKVLGVPDIDWQDSFFELGGHSLLAEALVEAVGARFGVEVSLRTLFDHPRLSDFAEQVLSAPRGESAGSGPEAGPAPAEDADAQWRPLPHRMALGLSREQRPDGVIPAESIICKVFEFPGLRVDRARLDRAVRWAAAVNPALTAEYRIDASHGPLYRTRPPRPGLVELVRSASDDWEAVRRTADKIAGEEIVRDLDVREGRALHVACVHGPAAGFALVIRVDHSVCDGLSFNRFLNDVSDAYATDDEQGFRTGHTRPDLAEIAVAERHVLEGAGAQALRAAWRARLPRGVPEMFVNDATPWSQCPPHGGTVQVTLRGEEYRQHLAEVRQHRVTGFMVATTKILRALRPALLNDELAFFCPFPGRFVPEAAGTVGNFVNLLPVLVDSPRGADTPSTLKAVRNAMLWTLQHQGLPFATVLDEVREVDPTGEQYPKKRRSLFIAGNEPNHFTLDGASATPRVPDLTSAMFDLSVWVTDTGSELACSAVYRRSLLDHETVRAVLAAVGTPLEPLPADDL
ncbi:condensation domain-containing protein [Streptomyces maremycinicus]|uniref:condensation domain-containing protein n=1 Tax=Streptomyces maremycinicus TaxID=1679753 RepID=UPI000787A08F|nr:condensation domain-containing protein [Streptomyces sp. NBRC 110468]